MTRSTIRQLRARISPSPALSLSALGRIRTCNLLIRSAPGGRFTGSRQVPNYLKSPVQMGCKFRTAKSAGTDWDALGPNCWLFCWLFWASEGPNQKVLTTSVAPSGDALCDSSRNYRPIHFQQDAKALEQHNSRCLLYTSRCV